MSRQERIVRATSRKKRAAQPTLQIQLTGGNEQDALDRADDAVLEIVAERLGELEARHGVVDGIDDERISAIDDERMYEDNVQEGGQ